MSYKETSLTGTQWTRASGATIQNPVSGEKAITFVEETVKALSDGTFVNTMEGTLRETLANPGEVFELVSPADDTPLGKRATYMDVYVMLHSLYLHIAGKRDKNGV